MCITPCLGEHRNMQQALGRFGAVLSHQESFKDLIYECTWNFLAQINPKHLLLALSALKETCLNVPRGIRVHSRCLMLRLVFVLASHCAGCPPVPARKELPCPAGGWMAASVALWLLAESSVRWGGEGLHQGVDGLAHSWTEEQVKQLNHPCL